MEKAIQILQDYLNEAKESYNIWLVEYDRSDSTLAEEKMLEYKGKVILLEEILRDLMKR